MTDCVEFLCDTGACKTIAKETVPNLELSKDYIWVKSADGETQKTNMSKPLTIEDPKTGLKVSAKIVVYPKCQINLLGRDLMTKLGIAVVPIENGMRAVRTKKEEEDLKDLPADIWTQGPSDVGLLTSIPPVEIKSKTDWRPRIKQYPLKEEAIAGIEPVIKDLLKGGIIRECSDSPCNTPIFPVQKANGTDWRMAQDLWAVNEAVQTRAQNVPNPHTLLNSLGPENKFFTVIDISNAFFTQAIMTCLADFELPDDCQLLVYVDDLLVASSSEASCRAASLALLKHLHKTGNKVSKKNSCSLWYRTGSVPKRRRKRSHDGYHPHGYSTNSWWRLS
uniref:Peptidase A2 domain-containing protein n=1 Tax=Kryptolebias marmoratus TaxID=37003 RepID=A0A3Q3AQK7_KRYMA